jgi:hypothetical protein
MYIYNVAGTQLAQSNSGSLCSLYAELVAGTPYIVTLDNTGSFAPYQFQMTATATSSIGGTFDYSGLPGSISSIISSATVNGYLDSSPNTQIVSGVSASGNAWSALIPANTIGQSARLVVRLNLNNGLELTSYIQTVLPTTASGLDFSSPTAVATGVWHNRNTFGSGGDWMLWIPAAAGTYVLDAERTDGSMDTYMYLYDALTGVQITYDDDGGGVNNNSRIQRSDIAAGHPYLVRVRDYHNRSGAFRFKAEAVSTTKFEGTWTRADSATLVFAGNTVTADNGETHYVGSISFDDTEIIFTRELNEIILDYVLSGNSLTLAASTKNTGGGISGAALMAGTFTK